jgi:hypothetical protein
MAASSPCAATPLRDRIHATLHWASSRHYRRDLGVHHLLCTPGNGHGLQFPGCQTQLQPCGAQPAGLAGDARLCLWPPIAAQRRAPLAVLRQQHGIAPRSAGRCCPGGAVDWQYGGSHEKKGAGIAAFRPHHCGHFPAFLLCCTPPASRRTALPNLPSLLHSSCKSANCAT